MAKCLVAFLLTSTNSTISHARYQSRVNKHGINETKSIYVPKKYKKHEHKNRCFKYYPLESRSKEIEYSIGNNEYYNKNVDRNNLNPRLKTNINYYPVGKYETKQLHLKYIFNNKKYIDNTHTLWIPKVPR